MLHIEGAYSGTNENVDKSFSIYLLNEIIINRHHRKLGYMSLTNSILSDELEKNRRDHKEIVLSTCIYLHFIQG